MGQNCKLFLRNLRNVKKKQCNPHKQEKNSNRNSIMLCQMSRKAVWWFLPLVLSFPTGNQESSSGNYYNGLWFLFLVGPFCFLLYTDKSSGATMNFRPQCSSQFCFSDCFANHFHNSLRYFVRYLFPQIYSFGFFDVLYLSSCCSCVFYYQIVYFRHSNLQRRLINFI